MIQVNPVDGTSELVMESPNQFLSKLCPEEGERHADCPSFPKKWKSGEPFMLKLDIMDIPENIAWELVKKICNIEAF